MHDCSTTERMHNMIQNCLSRFTTQVVYTSCKTVIIIIIMKNQRTKHSSSSTTTKFSWEIMTTDSVSSVCTQCVFCATVQWLTLGKTTEPEITQPGKDFLISALLLLLLCNWHSKYLLKTDSYREREREIYIYSRELQSKSCVRYSVYLYP